VLKVIFIMAHCQRVDVTKCQLTVCKIMTKLIRAKYTGYGSLQMALLGKFKQS